MTDYGPRNKDYGLRTTDYHHLAQRLIQIRDYVFHIFDPHRHSHQPVRDSKAIALGLRDDAWSSCRMRYQRPTPPSDSPSVHSLTDSSTRFAFSSDPVSNEIIPQT